MTKAFAFARVDNWGAAKIPPLLAVAYLEIVRLNVSSGYAVRSLACVLVSICCVAVYGHVINDICDLESDRLAGKANRLANLTPFVRGLLLVLFLAGAFLPAATTSYPPAALVLLALNCLWPTIYSIPGARLKERGLLGVGCDALGSHVTPTLFVVTFFERGMPSGFGIAVTIWAAALGIKGILHHQIADRDADLLSGTATFATARPVDVLQRFLSRFNLLVELPVSVLLAVMVARDAPLVPLALALYVASETVKYRLGFRFALSADPGTIRASVPFANERFYVGWLPLMAALQLGIDRAELLWLPLLHLVVFRGTAIEQLADWRAMAQAIQRERASTQRPVVVASLPQRKSTPAE